MPPVAKTRIPASAENPLAQWREAGPGYDWQFPRDFYAHPEYKTEWWYITGNLVTDDAAAA